MKLFYHQKKIFKHFQSTQIISYMDHFLDRKECQCHVYTYPSQMSYYPYLSNQFSGGYYPCVRIVSLYDEYPFEQSTNDNYHLSVVEYSHLIELDIERVHDDYVKQFLCDTKTCFRKNIGLRIADRALLKVTKHFTRKDTRMNCIKVDNLCLWREWRSSKSFQEYFPSIKEKER
jgi:hypothetical protein